jgi:hypothetical protein
MARWPTAGSLVPESVQEPWTCHEQWDWPAVLIGGHSPGCALPDGF